MQKKQFPDKTFAVNVDYNPDFEGRFLSGLSLKLDGMVTAGGGGGVSGLTLDCPAKLLGTVEVVESVEPIIRVDAVDLYHLDALANKSYGVKTASTPAATTTEPYLFNVDIPFAGSWLPPEFVLVDAGAKKCLVRGKFGALADYASTNMSSLAGTLRVVGDAPDMLRSAYLRPKFFQKNFDCSSTSSNLEDSIDFQETTLVVGLMLRQYDNSGAGDAQRVDGLVREIRIDIQAEGEIIRARWGQMKTWTKRFFGVPLAELKAGIGFIPMLDSRQPLRGFPYRLLPAGSKLIVHVDTASTVEAEYTAITPAASDALIVTVIGYTARMVEID